MEYLKKKSNDNKKSKKYKAWWWRKWRECTRNKGGLLCRRKK
jgi:hypothetical protein